MISTPSALFCERTRNLTYDYDVARHGGLPPFFLEMILSIPRENIPQVLSDTYKTPRFDLVISEGIFRFLVRDAGPIYIFFPLVVVSPIDSS